jgi:sugar/nucleoside kinase (ribokinase family)
MLGHFAKDRLIVDGRGHVASGGGVYYGSIALRRLGIRVAVVTRLHPEDFSRLDELREAGVDVYAATAEQTSGIANYYDSSDMERRICEPLGFAGKFNEQDIPAVNAKIYIVASIIAGEVDLSILEGLSARGPVAVDIQGFVRVRQEGDPEAGLGPALVFRPWPDLEKGLSMVTYLKVDRAEAELLTGNTDLRAAARELAGYGPREIVVTQTCGVTVLAGGEFYESPFTPRSLEGRTGRGDTCFSTYLGMRLTRPPEEATRVAGAVTTLKQEEPGPWRGTWDDIESLLKNRADRDAL